uniref:ArnT family glycosyltransferase n=1 Tax=uncultured Muriicola sp. TaxID=1583102 RepID=UPI002639674C
QANAIAGTKTATRPTIRTPVISCKLTTPTTSTVNSASNGNIVAHVPLGSVLTGFTVFAIWQLAVYIEKGSLVSLILGAFGAGIAFSTKGQIALLVIGLPLLCHLAYTGKWKVLLHWKVILALGVFVLTISPMLYAYYHQFDLHPEKVIRGKGNRSGLFFIFWEQSFERLSGEGVGKNSSDYFFFFHTFLWVFLPWTIIGIVGYWNQLRTFIKLHFRKNSKHELLTVGGISLLFIIISFAQFKLPHYLNILIPLFSVLAAAYLVSLKKRGRTKALNLVLAGQYFILGLVFTVTAFICFYVFEWDSWLAYLPLFMGYGVVAYFIVKKEAPYVRIITISVLASVLLNGVLNLHFYPELLNYQGGSSMAAIVNKQEIPVDRIYKLSERHTWALDFYNEHPVRISTANEIGSLSDVWVYTTEAELTELTMSGIVWDREYDVDQFRITRLQGKFLNPTTRPLILNKMYLLHIK